MPERETSCVFFPRKEAEDPAHLTRTISISYEALEGLFHLPLKEAAREVGLCPTTFKKACRRFFVEKWPFRKGQSRNPNARKLARTEGAIAAIRLAQQSSASPTFEATEVHTTRPATEVHQDMSAVTVSCTPPGWDASAPCEYFTRRTSSSSTVPFSRITSSDSTSSELQSSNPFGAVSSSAAPEGLAGLMQQAFDTRPWGEAENAGPSVQHKMEVAAPSYIDSLRGSLCIGMPVPACQPPAGSCGGQHGGTAPPEAERSCIEAIMDYLDGPLASNFDFMFSDEEGDSPPQEGALPDDDFGTEEMPEADFGAES